MQSRAVALVKLARYLGRRSMYASEDPRSPSGRSRGSDRLVAVLTGLVAAAVYVALGQTTLHHNDGHRILELIGTGELDFGRHHLATPVMYAFHQVVGAPLGLPPFQSVTLLNGVSSAVAVGLFYSGVRALGVSTPAALGAAALFGGCFPVLFFATLVEFHGVFLPWATLSFWLACHWQRRARLGWAVAMGAVAGVATQLHSMGIFASGLFAAWFWTARPDVPARRRLAQSAAAIAAHAAVFLAGTAIWKSLGWSVGSALDALPRGAALIAAIFEAMPRTAWRELLLPFAPLPLFAAWALTKPAHRAQAAALGLACLPYLALSGLILGVSEHGAYLATVAAPMAALAAQVVGPRVLAGAALVTILVNAGLTWAHDTEGPRYRAFVAGLREVAGADRCLLLYLEDPVPGPDQYVDELAALRVLDEPTACQNIGELFAELQARPAAEIAAMAKALPALYGNPRLLMGKATHQTLTDRYPSGPKLLAALEQGFRFEPLGRGGFAGFELLPR